MLEIAFQDNWWWFHRSKKSQLAAEKSRQIKVEDGWKHRRRGESEKFTDDENCSVSSNICFKVFSKCLCFPHMQGYEAEVKLLQDKQASLEKEVSQLKKKVEIEIKVWCFSPSCFTCLFLISGFYNVLHLPVWVSRMKWLWQRPLRKQGLRRRNFMRSWSRVRRRSATWGTSWLS